MTKKQYVDLDTRDDIAIAVLHGLIASGIDTTNTNAEEIVSKAYTYADALLKFKEE